MDINLNESYLQNNAGVLKNKRIFSRRKNLDYAKSKRAYCVMARIRDILLSVLALIFLSPVMLIAALAIIIDDPKGSPIFKQERCGMNGKTFRLYKFRSMCVDAEARLPELMKDNEADGPAFKITEDPRITRVGKFIRKTSIDELPQLVNILKGDMSIVGPRPALPREVEQYNEYYRQRLCVTPGLTCYWQIQENRNDISFERWVELDIQYIQERSLMEDVKIIFKTFKSVFTMQGR